PGKIFIYLLGLWLVLYGLLHFLNINDKQHNKPLLTNPNEFSRELLPLPAPTDGGEQQNALFHEYKFFYFPELPMKRLQNALLQDLNIKFECPDGKKQTLLPSANFEKTTLANILCTLLQEVGFGFYYADNVITAMPMNKLQMALNTTITSSTMLTSGTQPVANVTGYQATFPMQ
ncbi:TPA: hypothetical protein DDW35_13930, partial [Candidatus Sumerlaeota bacterium]|nr:hypothetical protein [Candidatus Sumerlaeota bacterium]